MVKKSIQYGNHQLTIETGRIARQADAAVLVSLGETVVLVTAVGKKTAPENQDFFPLTVNYQEKSYAAGMIPGGFFKREGRPTERETLTSRLIDRPIRPLFPKGFKNEVQIVATVVSMDPQIDSDIPAMIGASAALALSGMPFQGPIAAARVGYANGQYQLNSTLEQLETTELNLVVAGTKDAVLMVESEAKELSEEVMLGAVLFGHEQMQVVIDMISDMAQSHGKPSWDWQPPAVNETLKAQVAEHAKAGIEQAYQIAEKQTRNESLDALRDKVVAAICPEDNEAAPAQSEVLKLFHDLESDAVRGRILAGDPRIDGRDTRTVRPIHIDLGVLPRTHGSALFTRGETQALVVTTLGSGRDAQLIDELQGQRKDNFMLHYNFPPYCVGETGFMSGPKRREIGHGKLAKRALMGVMPAEDEFPYVLRVVSEVTESNGSSSMASVCGGILAMMDAGVPIKAPVAGVAMGLIKEDNRFAVLTDILGDEDHLGDMDFKVAGSEHGVTALQMDIKITGITPEIMEAALAQAKEGRLHILGIMNEAISAPREQVSQFAPRIMSFKINPDKIREVIGKGGATIKALTEETGVSIDITDDGTVTIAAPDTASGDAAKQRIDDLVMELEVGKVYQGVVAKIVDFGAFVDVKPGKSGLVHISQIKEERVEKVEDELSEGQEVTVKVLEIDRQGRVRLTMKDIDA